MTFKQRFTTAIATGAVLLNALAPAALAAENISVAGNGAFSDSYVKVAATDTTVVEQENDAKVTNNISSNASTGGNSASYNTGGETRIVTGDAITKTDVSTEVNLNRAIVEDCNGCDNGDLTVKISGNSAYSDNTVKAYDDNFVSVTQDNDAKIKNNIDANANTGKNDASFNTGGDSIIVTGDAVTKVDVENMANANIATIGGGSGGANASSVEISGNGAFSDNTAKLELDSAIVLDQYNKAKIYNDIYAKANTGKNDATFNTGGETAIVTGDAKTVIDVNNLVNFNAASIDCECVLEDLNVNIKGNGAESYNKVKIDAEDEIFNFQDNYAKLYNDVYGNSKTGYNDVSFSTGDVESDPIIATGHAWSLTDVSNKGNVNHFSEGTSLHLPGNWEVDAHFDLSDLLSLLHLG